MKKVKITILKTMLNEDLAKEYGVCGRYVKAAAGSTSQSKKHPRNKTRFRPTALAYQGGCSKI